MLICSAALLSHSSLIFYITYSCKYVPLGVLLNQAFFLENKYCAFCIRIGQFEINIPCRVHEKCLWGGEQAFLISIFFYVVPQILCLSRNFIWHTYNKQFFCCCCCCCVQATYRPLLKQVLEEIFHPDRRECPDVEHMSGGLTDLLKTGFSMFMKVTLTHLTSSF